MSTGALSSLAFASSAVASASLGCVFVSTAPLASEKFKAGVPQAKRKKFQLFGKDNNSVASKRSGRRGSRKLARYIATPARGQQHPAIIKSDRLEEPADSPDLYACEAPGAKLERRVHSAPPKTLHLIEQQAREAQMEGMLQQGHQPGSTLQETRSPPSQRPSCSAKNRPPADPYAKQPAPRSPKSPQLVSEHHCGASPGAGLLEDTNEKEKKRDEDDDEDEDESDWDEGVTPTTPRPLRCSSIAFPPASTLSEEKQLELAAEFAKSVKPCENWDEDFDIDIETQALQVPSAVAAAQFSVRMDLHNIHDFAKQIEALKSLRTEAQHITKSVPSAGEVTTKVHSLQYAYASDWEQADVIIELGEIAHDDEGAATMQNGVACGVLAGRASSVSITSIPEDEDEEEDLTQAFGSATLQQDGPHRHHHRYRHHRQPQQVPTEQVAAGPGCGASLPSDKHLNVLKNILLDGLSPEAQRAIQPFLVGDSVQFSVEMMPGLLAHLKNLTGRLEACLSELRALRLA